MRVETFVLGCPLLTGEAVYARDHPRGLRRVHRDNYTLWAVQAGSGSMGSGQGRPRLSLAAGDAMLCPPGAAMVCRQDSAADWVYRWVAFQPRPPLERLLGWPGVESGPARLRVADAELWRRIRDALGDLDDAVHRFSPPRRTDLCFNLLEQALLWLEAANPHAHRPAEDPRVLQAVSYIARTYHRKLTVGELARQCHLSPSRFAHLFRRITGRPPMRYVEQLRLEHAQRLLLGTTDTLAKIASACGFCNEFHFSHVFKRRVGRSPTAFRRGRG